jgi:hypothetical protein
MAWSWKPAAKMSVVGDKHDRAVVSLADIVRAVFWSDGEGARKRGAGLGGLVQRGEPRSEVDAGRVVLVLTADTGAQGRADKLDRLGNDPPGCEGLQGELTREDVTTAVIAHIQDQPVLREQADQPDELCYETHGIVHGEREDADMTKGAQGRRHASGSEDAGHAGRHVFSGRGRHGGERRRLGGLRLASHLRCEQQRPGPVGFVAIEVKPLGGGSGADLVEVTHEGRQVCGDQPFLAQLAFDAVVTDIADGDPLFVGW